MAVLALLFSGAIFGFFYAWVCSTMWGLDAADPNVAIAAMQAMNASVRNLVFAPAFWGTPLVLMAAALVAWKCGEGQAALFFGAGVVLYVLGAMVPTVTVNVALNETLALVETPLDSARAKAVWQSYSEPWQRWNVVRTVFSGITLVLTGVATLSVGWIGDGRSRSAPG
ncbi:MAG: DUF1772 domain-containing protein [Deltaproteobacteria bacterium]|nr:DUF1772 domain-containing protein [Deltaproteobacteria bacterium]